MVQLLGTLQGDQEFALYYFAVLLCAKLVRYVGACGVWPRLAVWKSSLGSLMCQAQHIE